MDYEKKYKETIERARKLQENSNGMILKKWLWNIFPELQESEDEDEKIRKELIDIVAKSPITFAFEDKEKVLAWLEKQGNPADINPSEFDLRLNKLLKQFETLPKEELASSLSFYLNTVQNDGTYKDEEKQGEKQTPQSNERAWLYLVADVLTWMEGIGQYLDNPKVQELAKKLQKEYGQKLYIEKQGEQKPAWSEEDEKILKDILVDVKFEGYNNDMLANSYKKINWLKSLKEKFKIQTRQGVSKEDEYSFMMISGSIRQDQDLSPEDKNKLRLWLKSIIYQSHWKPTEEQMKALANALSLAKNCGEESAFDLRTLHEQLKKLTE